MSDTDEKLIVKLGQRNYAIQGVSIFSVLHFSVEIITRRSGNCVIKRLGVRGKPWPPAAV